MSTSLQTYGLDRLSVPERFAVMQDLWDSIAENVEKAPLTDAQKAAIAETRNFYEAKLAELEVLHQSKINGILDPAERETLDQQYRREREHLTNERDRKVARQRA